MVVVAAVGGPIMMMLGPRMMVGDLSLVVVAAGVPVVMVRQQAVTQREYVGQPEQRDDERTDWHLVVKVSSFL